MKAMEVFFCYAHEDRKLRDTLAKHFGALRRSGQIAMWHDYEILPGAEWMSQIDKHLNTANIVLLLISPDFINSEYCWGVEMKKALERHEAGEARVLPIILHPVDWQGTPISKLQALPSNGRPITTWPNRHQAYVNVAKGVREVVEDLQREKEMSLSVEKLVMSSNDELQKGNMSAISYESRLPPLDENQQQRYLTIVNLLYLLGFREELLGTWDSAKFEQVMLEKRREWSRDSTGIGSKASAALRHLKLIPDMVRMTSSLLERQLLAEFARSLEHD